MPKERIVSVEELQKKGKHSAWVGKQEVLLLMTPEGVRVYSGMCPHQGGPLVEGVFTGSKLTCPWHGCTFELNGGDCIDIGACRNVSGMKLKTLPYSIGEDAQIYVELPDSAS